MQKSRMVSLKTFPNTCRLPSNTATIRVLVEGPYATSGAGRNCKTSFSLLVVMVFQVFTLNVLICQKSKNQSIKLVWIIKTLEVFELVYGRVRVLEENKCSNHSICHSTSRLQWHEIFEQDSNSEKKSDEKDSVESPQNSFVSKIKQDLSHVEFIEGRPNIVEQVEQEIKETDGALGFVTCGHPAMVDELRSAVTKNLNASKHRVEFHEQLQTWA